MGYFLLPVLAVTSSEPVIHLLQLLVLLAAIPATISLAIRLGAPPSQARIAAMLLVAFPTVLALTDSAMPDTLAMTLGVIGIERYLAWLDNRAIGSAIAAATCLGLAPYARIHTLCLFGIAALGMVVSSWREEKNRDFRVSAFLPLAIGIAIFLAVTLLTRESGSNGPLPPTSNMFTAGLASNVRALFSYYVLCVPVAILWVVSVRRWAVWLLGAAGAVFGIFSGLLKTSVPYAFIWVLAMFGLACIAHLAWRGARTRSPELFLAAWMLVPIVAVPYFQLPPKYLMATAPAAAIAGYAFLRGEKPAIRNLAFSVTIAACAILSLLILKADQQFADMPREAVAELVAPHTARGERVWFTGQWGVYWYAQKAGAKVVMAGVSDPRPGDLFLTGQQDFGAPVIALFPHRTLVAERVFAWTGGRTMGSHAGLYSNQFGPLPWAWGSGEVDRYQLWRIE